MRNSLHSCLMVVAFLVLYTYCAPRFAIADEWLEIGDGLHGVVGSPDIRYSHNNVPDTDKSRTWTATAWRGERVNGHFVLWTKTGAQQVRLSATSLVSITGNEIPSACIRPHFVRYVLADETFKTCGLRPPNETPVLVEDVIDNARKIDLKARRTYPVWVSIDVPFDAKPGMYSGEFVITFEGDNILSFDIKLEILNLVLPDPAEWSFHLDLWQNPWSVARYHSVESWSEEHWQLLEPILRMLADAGQKCLTATIVHHPWNGQTFDPYGSMITWNHAVNGDWTFDYTLFDRWVRFGEKCGITKAINCYSMIPWGYVFHYYDSETGDFKSVKAVAGTEEYNEMWTAFLRDFVSHLKNQGLFEKTVIAMDERPVEDMLKVISLVHSVAPGLKIALAGGDHKELYDEIHDYCFLIKHRLDPELIRQRKQRGQPTTFYVCCTPFRPNTFTISPLYESAFMGWYAFAKGYSGFLRWAANSWVLDPLHDSSYDKWQSGDTFLIYPGPRSSLRFERLREGIQDYEKLHIITSALEQKGSKAQGFLQKLNRVLQRFEYPPGPDQEVLLNLHKAQEILLKLSRYVAE